MSQKIKDKESNLTWTFGEKKKIFTDAFFQFLSFTCRQVFKVHNNTYRYLSQRRKNFALRTCTVSTCSQSTGERLNVKKTFFSFLCFLLIQHLCVLCSLCSLNQRCMAPFLWQCWRKYTETLSFGCSMYVCVFKQAWIILQNMAALWCSSTAVTIVEVFHLSLSFILQACKNVRLVQ